jgi:Mg2+ and Co2+ transporter CorA
MIRTAIIEQLKNKLKPEVEKFMTYLATAMEDGVISEAEERMLEQMEEDMEEISDNYLSKNEKWMRDDKEEDSEDPLTGAVRSMSEETGGVIAGRMNAIVINQSDQTVIMRNQLIYQAEIAANTRASASELSEIKATLKRIENKDSSLLSQGIS